MNIYGQELPLCLLSFINQGPALIKITLVFLLNLNQSYSIVRKHSGEFPLILIQKNCEGQPRTLKAVVFLKMAKVWQSINNHWGPFLTIKLSVNQIEAKSHFWNVREYKVPSESTNEVHLNCPITGFLADTQTYNHLSKHNDQYHRKVLLSSFHLKGHTRISSTDPKVTTTFYVIVKSTTGKSGAFLWMATLYDFAQRLILYKAELKMKQ